MASSLLFIVGCESELDRCMKANEMKMSMPRYDDEISKEDGKKLRNHPLTKEIIEKAGEEMQLVVDKWVEMCDEYYELADLPKACIALMDETEDIERAAWNKAVAMINSEEANEISAKALKLCNSQGVY